MSLSEERAMLRPLKVGEGKTAARCRSGKTLCANVDSTRLSGKKGWADHWRGKGPRAWREKLVLTIENQC